MGLHGAMAVSHGPIYQELARRIGLERMGEAIERLDDGNGQIGTNLTTFWLRDPLAISAGEQTRFLSALAQRILPFPRKAQEQVAEITRVDAGPGWSLHAKTGWQNAPAAGVGWWVGWVRRGDQITPFALNIAMAGGNDAPKRVLLGRASLSLLRQFNPDLGSWPSEEPLPTGSTLLLPVHRSTAPIPVGMQLLVPGFLPSTPLPAGEWIYLPARRSAPAAEEGVETLG
jgi:hypothetical protein